MKNISSYNISVILIISVLLSACGGGERNNNEESRLTDIIVFVPSGYKFPPIDAAFQLKALGIFNNGGANQDLTQETLWESSDPSIATISNSGEVRILTIGEVIITATFADLSHNTVFKIFPPTSLVSIDINDVDNGYSLDEGSELPLTVTASFSASDPSEDYRLVTWSSSNSLIANISQNGTIQAIRYGEAVITAIASENTTIRSTISVRIKPISTQITLPRDTTYINIDQTDAEQDNRLIVKQTFSDGSIKLIPTLVRWTYDAQGIAQIDRQGKISATAVGTVNATATFDNFELTHKIVVEDDLNRLFVVNDTKKFIKLAWHPKLDATSYTLYINDGEETEVNLDADTLDYTYVVKSPNKPHYFRLAFTRQNTLSEASKSITVWPHFNLWQRKLSMESIYFSAGSSINEMMYIIGGETETLPNSLTTELWEYNMLENTWNKETPLAEPVKNASTCAFGQFIYVFGGNDADGLPLSAVHVYDTISANWQLNKTSLPIALSNMSCHVVGDSIYIIGGHDGTGPVASTYRYEHASNLWDTTLPALNTPRYKHAGNVLKDTIYISGGITNSQPATAQTETLNPSAATPWQLLSAMNTARSGFALHAWDGKLHAIGGTDNNDQALVSSIETYDPEDDSWQTTAAMPFGNASFNSTVFNDSLYTWGGSKKAVDLSDGRSQFMRYDFMSGTWTHTSRKLSVQSNFSTAILNKQLYIIGGENAAGATSEVTAYNINNNTWKSISPLIESRRALSAITYNTELSQEIYVFGGQNQGGNLRSVEMYNAQTNAWVTKRKMNFDRAFASSALLNEKVYVFGGLTSDSSINFEIYDIAFDNWSWSEENVMPQARSHATAITFHGKIYLVGGKIDGEPTNIVSIYNPSENNWAEVESHLLTARELPGSTIFNEKILIFGGVGKLESPLTSVEVYNDFAILPLWLEKLPELPSPGGVFRGNSFEDKIILIKEGAGTENLRNNLYILR